MTSSPPDEDSGLPVNYDPDEPVFTMNADPATENKADMARFTEGATHDPAQLPLEGEAREQLLALTPDNLDADGNAHFLLVSERHAGRCGHDGEAWPCRTFQTLEAEQRKLTGQAPDTATPELVNLDDVAAALGMNREQLEASMRNQEKTMAGELDGPPAGMSNDEWALNGFPDTGR
jgi:hypothetical protein